MTRKDRVFSADEIAMLSRRLQRNRSWNPWVESKERIVVEKFIKAATTPETPESPSESSEGIGPVLKLDLPWPGGS